MICSNSFHHYPNPQDFFNSVYRVLRKEGRLILRDYTSSDTMVWLMNHIEMPLAHLCGHGDVKIYTKPNTNTMIRKSGLTLITLEVQKRCGCNLVARK